MQVVKGKVRGEIKGKFGHIEKLNLTQIKI